MLLELNVPAGRLREVARRLKRAVDEFQDVDSGWRYVDFDHPAWGREPADSVAERIPGNVIAVTDEPGSEADVLIVVLGYVDSFTGDVRLGNDIVVEGAGARTEEDQREDDDEVFADEYPNSRLPALALFEEDGAKALLGWVHETREGRFETGTITPELETAVTEWLETVAEALDR